MRYSLDEFDAVLNEIERQGGALMTEPHMPLDIVFTRPPYKRNQTLRRFKAGGCPCGHETRFAIEYNGEDGRAAIATVCAVCDNMGAWPRYRHAFEDAGGEL